MVLLDALLCRAVAPELRQILWRGLGMEFNVSLKFTPDGWWRIEIPVVDSLRGPRETQE